MTVTTANPVVHFEIGCRDLEKTTLFYSQVFGWSATGIPFASLINTGSADGIQGHITALGHEPHNYVNIYIEVADIEQALADIEQAGGKRMLGPVPLPNGSLFAWFHDPEGNMLGLRTPPVAL